MALESTQHGRPTEQEASTSVAGGTAPDTRTRRSPTPSRKRIAALEAEVAVLEAELETRDRELEQVVERYEALLDERARAHQASVNEDGVVWSGAEESESRGRGVLSALRSLF